MGNKSQLKCNVLIYFYFLTKIIIVICTRAILQSEVHFSVIPLLTVLEMVNDKLTNIIVITPSTQK